MVNSKMDQKADAFLTEIPETVSREKDLSFLVGNCYVRKKEYPLARKYYEESIVACLEKRYRFWYASGEANLLVAILILSGKLELAEKAKVELGKFYQEPQHDTWPVSFYAFSIVELVQNRTPDNWIEKLFTDPKNREALNLGAILKGIVDKDEIGFNAALDTLLRVHDRRAKYGSLRETPEGFISMDGMALVYLAMKKGLTVRLQSQYIVPDYFDINKYNS